VKVYYSLAAAHKTLLLFKLVDISVDYSLVLEVAVRLEAHEGMGELVFQAECCDESTGWYAQQRLQHGHFSYRTGPNGSWPGHHRTLLHIMTYMIYRMHEFMKMQPFVWSLSKAKGTPGFIWLHIVGVDIVGRLSSSSNAGIPVLNEKVVGWKGGCVLHYFSVSILPRHVSRVPKISCIVADHPHCTSISTWTDLSSSSWFIIGHRCRIDGDTLGELEEQETVCVTAINGKACNFSGNHGSTGQCSLD